MICLITKITVARKRWARFSTIIMGVSVPTIATRLSTMLFPLWRFRQSLFAGPSGHVHCVCGDLSPCLRSALVLVHCFDRLRQYLRQSTYRQLVLACVATSPCVEIVRGTTVKYQISPNTCELLNCIAKRTFVTTWCSQNYYKLI